MPLRLGIDLQSAVDDFRGMGRVVRSLLTCFLRDYQQHEYVLFAKNPSQIEPLKFMALSIAPDFQGFRLSTLADLPGSELDVCWYPWSRIDLAPKSGRKVVTIHDMARFAFPHTGFFSRWDQRRDEQRYHQAVRLADQVITISAFSAAEIEKYLKLPADRIPVIMYGVDEAAFAPVAGEPSVLPPEYADPFLLFVGADDEAKNLPALLKAFEIIKRKYRSPLSLICLGAGEAGRKRHQKLLEDCDIEDAVFFSEMQLDDMLLRQLYGKAEMLVFPSIYEGFGLPPLEAMAAGTPVVCSRSAALPEVVGDAAIFFDAASPAHIAETVLHLLTDKAVYRALVARGHQRVREFSWSKSAAGHMKIFEGSGSI